jgi:hypothetical protein
VDAAAERDPVPDDDAEAQRRERLAREPHVDVRGTVAARGGRRDATAEREVLRPLEVRRVRAPVDLGRREDPRVDVAHRARAGERTEVGRALVLSADADSARDATEDDGTEQHRRERTDDEERRLALLGVSAGVGHVGQPGAEGVTGLRPICTAFATNV